MMLCLQRTGEYGPWLLFYCAHRENSNIVYNEHWFVYANEHAQLCARAKNAMKVYLVRSLNLRS